MSSTLRRPPSRDTSVSVSSSCKNSLKNPGRWNAPANPAAPWGASCGATSSALIPARSCRVESPHPLPGSPVNGASGPAATSHAGRELSPWNTITTWSGRDGSKPGGACTTTSGRSCVATGRWRSRYTAVHPAPPRGAVTDVAPRRRAGVGCGFERRHPANTASATASHRTASACVRIVDPYHGRTRPPP